MSGKRYHEEFKIEAVRGLGSRSPHVNHVVLPCAWVDAYQFFAGSNHQCLLLRHGS
jgi:hypothetical protein